MMGSIPGEYDPDRLPCSSLCFLHTTTDHRLSIQNDPFHSVNVTQIYHPKTNTWTTGATLPTPRSGLAAVTVDTMIYAIGGGVELFNPQTNINEQYNPNPSTTQTSSPTSSPTLTPTQSTPPSQYPSPSPSVPELPSWIILPFVAFITLAVIIVRRKRKSQKPLRIS